MSGIAKVFTLLGGLAAVDYIPDGQFERTSTLFNAIGGFGYEAIDAAGTVATGTVNLGTNIAVWIDNRLN